MPFPTVTFAVFFAIVLVGTWALAATPRAMKTFLVAASLVFYGSWDVRFVGLVLASLAVSHVVGRRVAFTRGRRQVWWLRLGVGIHLGILGAFKYYGFFTAAVRDGLATVGVAVTPPLLEIALPVGISFLTFEAVAYLVELRRGDIAPPTLLDLATYVTFFAKLQSGPITRPSEFLPQLAAPRHDARVPVAAATVLVVRGLVKKLVLATYLGDALVDDVFATPAAFSSLEVLVGIYGYAVLLYLDFSAYTDLARGVALLLGFELPINFDRPYAATSIRDFWNRWHLSLSRWLRDFLFRPLVTTGTRSRAATHRNLVLVMLLAGLWHGAGWTFVVWGGIHGLGLSLERWRREHRRARGLPRPADTPWRRAVRIVVAFHVVAFAWVVFRADSLAHAGAVLRQLGAWGPAPRVTALTVAVIVGVLAVQFAPRDLGDRIQRVLDRAGPVPQIAVAAATFVLVDVLGPDAVPAFIYGRF